MCRHVGCHAAGRGRCCCSNSGGRCGACCCASCGESAHGAQCRGHGLTIVVSKPAWQPSIQFRGPTAYAACKTLLRAKAARAHMAPHAAPWPPAVHTEQGAAQCCCCRPENLLLAPVAQHIMIPGLHWPATPLLELQSRHRRMLGPTQPLPSPRPQGAHRKWACPSRACRRTSYTVPM